MRKYLIFLLMLLSGCIFVDQSPNRCYHLWDPSQKDNCLLMVAGETLNISKCDEISAKDLAQQCYSNLMNVGVSPNASTCEKLSGARMDDCLSALATNSNDTSLCMMVNFSFQRDNCLSTIAIARDRPDLCDQISTDASKNLCKNQIFGNLAIKNKDTSYCKLLIVENASNQDMVDRCILTMAKTFNDTSYCNQISNIFAKELCLTGKINPASCDQITNSTGREACQYIAAAYSNDPNQCSTMPTASMRDICYAQIAENTNNPQVCSFISSSYLKDQCVQLLQQPAVPS